ncbi:MAG: hypothetical protein ACYC6Y_30840 [Thermoguttaceae bacterium]
MDADRADRLRGVWWQSDASDNRWYTIASFKVWKSEGRKMMGSENH